MGRALLIICAGLLVALGYTFFGIKSQSKTLTNRNVNTYYHTKAKNTANTGIQIAIQRYNDDKTKQEFSNVVVNYEDAKLTLSLKELPTANADTIRVTSVSLFNGIRDSVISTFDISQKQQLVPIFAGALSKVGDQDVNFDKGNPKVHFNGNAPAGSGCEDKPGFTVNDLADVIEYGGSSNIDGNPDVAIDNSLKVSAISDLVNALAPKATTIGDDFDWSTSTDQNSGVYFLEGEANYTGQDVGYGILVVRNNSTLNVLSVAGKFTFNGLIIFENGSDFKGTGNAQFNGSVISVSDSFSEFNIQANGNFNAQYDCTTQKYADAAVDKTLDTTIYKLLSIYE